MNRENFKLVLDQIESHPETWDQEHWHCGTTHCFAGWAQILAGEKPESLTTRADARKFLGISYLEACWLFDAKRTISDFELFFSEGFWFDDGFKGFNLLGYDRDGYDHAGVNYEGYDCDGYNSEGVQLIGYDRDGYNFEGYDKDGLDRDGIGRME